MADNFDDELALLYDDILTRLNKGETLADIDLDSLIEVYDYAYDLSDEFVTAEIMNNVLQRDPDFQPMLERKAFRYALLSEIQGAKCVASILPESSFVKKLINMQTDWNATDWRDSYRRLFADVRHQSLDEYSAMCLIDLALGVDNVAHLSLLLEDILPLCRYPEDFLVDLSGTLLDNDMPDEAVTVLLELTTLQPFSLDYWLQLAELYINRLNNFEEGYNAIDYALAIDPDSGRALMLKGDLLMKVEGYEEDIHKIADRLLTIPEFKDEALYLKAGAFIKEEKAAQAVEYLVRYLDVCNNPLDIFVLLITVNEGPLSADLRERLVGCIRRADSSEIDGWLSRARKVMEDAAFDSLLDNVLEAGITVSANVFSMLLLHVYRSGKYEQACTLYDERKKSFPAGPFDTLVYVMAHLRNGDIAGMRRIVHENGEDIYAVSRNSGAEGMLLQVGSGKLIYDIDKYLLAAVPGKPDQQKLDNLDPFIL